MASASLSDHVRRSVEQEREQVAGRLAELLEQSERLHALVDQVDRDVLETGRLLRNMNEMLGVAPQLSIEAEGELRGQRLREIAIEILRRRNQPGAVVHYREWYGWLLARGLHAGGKDPLATFLTQIARAPEVESVRPRSGLYRLRAA